MVFPFEKGVITIYIGKPEILIGKSINLWQSIWEASGNNYYALWFVAIDAIFTLFLGYSADLEILCSRLFSLLVKFFSFNFMHKFSTQVVGVKILRY